MNVTVNGKVLNVIQQELEEPFGEDDLTKTSSDGSSVAITIGAYENRLNQVLGVMNYDFIVSEGHLECVEGKYMLHVTAKITIYDDERRPIVTKSACGGCNIILLTENGKPKSLKSDLDSAVSEAYKNCCQKLNVGVRQLRTLNSRKGGSGTSNAGRRDLESRERDEEKKITIQLMQRMQSGNKNYYAKSVDLKTGEEVVFKIFNKEFPSFERKIRIIDFVEQYGSGRKITFIGRETSFRGENQVIFSRWE